MTTLLSYLLLGIVILIFMIKNMPIMEGGGCAAGPAGNKCRKKNLHY